MVDEFFFADIFVIVSWSIISCFLIKKYEKYTLPIVFILPIAIILLIMLVNMRMGLRVAIDLGVAFGFMIFPYTLPRNILKKDIFQLFKKKEKADE
ncbi:MAG: hypothetical protein IJR46_07285 [Neisseriaceae bacterium]|nr:hypothetical protein [Neisseriaceae bacterium]